MQLKVFISSRLKELEEERAAVKEAVSELWNNENLSFRVWTWESGKEIPSGEHPDEVQSRGVMESDIYVLIIGQEYGDFEYGKSPTHKEYDTACSELEKGCILIYIKKSEKIEKKLEKWIDELKNKHAFRMFENSDQLKDLVKTRLRDIWSKQKPTIKFFPEQPPDIADFVNRDTEQNNLEDLVRRKNHMIIVQGIPGIGKTQIGAKLMENIKNDYMTYWKEMRNVNTFYLELIKNLAGFLRNNNDSKLADYIEGGGTDYEIIIGILLSSLKEKQYALFFDNYQVVEDNKVHDLFKRFKDKLTNSTVILTTRESPQFVNPVVDEIENKVKGENVKGFELEATREYLERKGVDVSEDQLVKVDQKIGGHPISLKLFASLNLSGKREVDEIIENLPETNVLDWLYHECYDKLIRDEQEVLEVLSVFRTAVTADACIQVSKTANVKKILMSLIRKFLVERKKNLYYLHDSIRELSYNMIDNSKEYHEHAGEYYFSLEKTPENITETCYHLIKYYDAINDRIIEYLMDTPGDAYTYLTILDVLGSNAIKSLLVFDLIEKILATDGSEIRFIAVETMVKNNDLDVDRALELLEKRIEDKNETEGVREKSISSLSTLMKFRFEKVIIIFEEIVNSRGAESLVHVCYALKDAGIKNEKTVQILRQIIASNGVTTNCKKLVSDILDDWKALGTSSEINYLYKLKEKDSIQAIEYLEDLMFGSNQFNRFNINYYFFAWVLGELYRVKKSESRVLMRRLIENVSGTIETPWIVSRVLLSKEGLQYDTIRDFIGSKNFLVRMSGFLTILQTYTCLDFFQRKYNIQDKNFKIIHDSVKEDSIELLDVLTRDEDELLREMAKIMLQEIVDPSEQQKLKVTQRVLGEMIEGFLKIASPDMLVKFVKAITSGDDLKTYYMVGVLVILSGTQVNPEKVYPILKVQNVYSDMATHIVLLYYYKIRNSPENLLEILNKFGFKSSKYLTRIGSIGTSHGLMLPIPEKILDTYESLLSNPKYQDRGSKIALLYSSSLMRKWFAFTEDYKTEHNHEINNIVRRADKFIQKLVQDEDKEVSMLADLLLNGIHFKS